MDPKCHSPAVEAVDVFETVVEEAVQVLGLVALLVLAAQERHLVPTGTVLVLSRAIKAQVFETAATARGAFVEDG